jgi:serine/threonine-protein kinase
MTPERWRAVKAVLETALEREGDQRAAFLDQACGDDDALRREVDSLLESARRSSGFLEPPRLRSRAGTYLIERLNAAFAGRYRIRRELGGGGMSRVFLAEEGSLGRRVVVKVLAPGPAQLAGVERFHREIRMTASLAHPNIVPVLATGELEGLFYYTMPFVEGESLKARLGRERRLDPPEAVGILTDVADALGYAHRRGIVHRDVKPANILLERGRALVLDFGIATGPVTAGGPEAVRLTADGIVVGTPAYMAPERAAADVAADHRADLYSLGVVAHEMLHGELPGSAGEHAADLRHQSPLDELVAQLLKRQPGDRPGSADEVRRRLHLILS